MKNPMRKATLAGLTAFLMLCLLGAVTAYWGLQLSSPPRAVATAQTAAVETPDRLPAVAARLSPASAQHTDGSRLAGIDARVLGTVAAGPGGRAVLLHGGKPVTLGVGEELEPGVTLGQVGSNFIELHAGAASRQIELSESTKPARPGKP